MKAKELRNRAWNALKGRYWWAVLAGFLASLFGAISTSAASSSSGAVDEAAEKFEQALGTLPEGAQAIFVGLIVAICLVCIAMSVIGGAVKLGYFRYNIALFESEEKPAIDLLFSRMKQVWKALWMNILIGLIVAVGCLLIVPGIIFTLMYSQSNYILAENPDLTVKEAMKKSKEMMKGNKWRCFCLDLSFIGWDILAGIVPSGLVLLTPYKRAAEAAFYLDLTGRLSAPAAE